MNKGHPLHLHDLVNVVKWKIMAHTTAAVWFSFQRLNSRIEEQWLLVLALLSYGEDQKQYSHLKTKEHSPNKKKFDF